MACTQKSSVSNGNAYFGPTTPKHGPDEIWVNNREEPHYMDPTNSKGVADTVLATNAFSRLVSIDPVTSKPIPDLAENGTCTMR